MIMSRFAFNIPKESTELMPGDEVQIGDEIHDHIPACSNCGRIKKFSSGGYAVVKLDSGETLHVRREDVVRRKSSVH